MGHSRHGMSQPQGTGPSADDRDGDMEDPRHGMSTWAVFRGDKSKNRGVSWDTRGMVTPWAQHGPALGDRSKDRGVTLGTPSAQHSPSPGER